MQGIVVDKLSDADLVVFTGGADIYPRLYTEHINKLSSYNVARDAYEIDVFSRSEGKKKIGICRGSQFLCVMAGGELIQHQENPYFLHRINSKIKVTSTHHQAAFPFKMKDNKYNVLGYTRNVSRIHLDGLDKEMNPPVECEIVHYPGIESLGIQGHPEMPQVPMESIKYFRGLLKNFMEDKL